jgi:hypothetical protein
VDISGKQDTLVSGTSIKTVNSTSLLGSGDIVIGGAVDSVNTQTGVVVLDTDDVAEGTNKYVTSAEKTILSNTSGVNTGDQDISGIATNASNITGKVSKSGDTMTGTLTGRQVAPSADSTYTLGTSTNYYSNGYMDRLYLNSTAYIDGAVAGTANLTGNLAILATSGSATHSLTLGSTSTGIALYNTVDQTTNYERVRMYWSGNALNIFTDKGGTGAAREIRMSAINSINQGLRLNSDATLGFVQVRTATSIAGSIGLNITGTLSSSSGIQYGQTTTPTISQSGTAGYTALLINATESSTGSGTKLLADFQVGGVSKVSIGQNGVLYPVQATTAGAPTYVKGGIYFDTTLNKLRVGGATAWETVTSV